MLMMMALGVNFFDVSMNDRKNCDNSRCSKNLHEFSRKFVGDKLLKITRTRVARNRHTLV